MNMKSDYRVFAKNIRKNLDIAGLSQSLVEKIRDDIDYQNSKNIMIYYPLPNEFDFRALINDDKNFYLPKMFENTLVVCPYCEELECGKYNIMEPCSEPVDSVILDYIIVPALLADNNKNRLGYGAGFYDRFLKTCKKAVKVVALPKDLIVENLPIDSFDVKMDKVIF